MNPPIGSAASERRREVRYPYRCNLRLRQQGLPFVTARTVNLSLTGMSLILPENFEPDWGPACWKPSFASKSPMQASSGGPEYGWTFEVSPTDAPISNWSRAGLNAFPKASSKQAR